MCRGWCPSSSATVCRRSSPRGGTDRVDINTRLEQIEEEAQQERFHLVSREEVVRTAQAEAERILEEAREMARQIRLEAEDYVDAKLAQFEIALERTSAELER